MPTVTLDRTELFARLGRSYTDEEFDELCFQFGVELDDVVEDAATKRVTYAIAVAANRTDLLCVEGLSRAIVSFLGNAEPPVYAITPPRGAQIIMHVKPSTQAIRPYVVCAVLRGVTFTQARYDSFIDLQDKLHNNIARKRTLVAIGTHDLDTLEPPFVYEALSPQDISFVPLSQTRAFRADELMEFYRTDPSVKHIKPYVDIIGSSPVYPVIFDARRTVCSLPPIINGEHSKVSLATRNVFIECTATDLTKAHVVLNAVVTMFAEYAEVPFTAEAVEVVYEEAYRAAGTGYTTPQLATRAAAASVATLSGIAGTSISAEDAVRLARRMQLTGRVTNDGASFEVDVPPTRPDILQECDIIEDVAIAYGYNNIVRTLPRTLTTGAQLPINKLTDALRAELARAGYDECLTLALCSREENFGALLLKDPGADDACDGSAVSIANPKTDEFQIGRTSMLPGLLKSLASNRAAPVRDGLRLFEVSDVMLRDASVDVGARNERRLAALYAGPTAGFEVIHGLLDRIMMLLEVAHKPFAWEEGASSTSPAYGRGGLRYSVVPETEIPTYFTGRGARVVVEHEDGRPAIVVGTFGVLHPQVLANFDLGWPVSVLEINVEPFV